MLFFFFVQESPLLQIILSVSWGLFLLFLPPSWRDDSCLLPQVTPVPLGTTWHGLRCGLYTGPGLSGSTHTCAPSFVYAGLLMA